MEEKEGGANWWWGVEREGGGGGEGKCEGGKRGSESGEQGKGFDNGDEVFNNDFYSVWPLFNTVGKDCK